MFMHGMIAGASIFIFAFAAAGQQGGATGGAAGSGAGAGTPSTGRPTTGRPTSPFPNDPRSTPRPIFISGKVLLSDGAAPSTQIKIERVCNGISRVEGYVDRKGTFGLELGRNMEVQDASVSSGTGFDPFGGGGGRRDPFQQGSGGPGMSERDLSGCEVRAALAGYRSDSISLASRRSMDNPDLGIIVLRPYGKSEGQLLSATTALAPKDAKKAYEKALDAIKKRKLEEAQTNLEQATTIYPRYAAAWYEMGRLLEQREQLVEAHRAYDQARAADSKYLPPYERLSFIAFKESKWQDVADYSDQLLRLDPATYPDAYYLSSVANFQLQHFDVAERHAREAIRLDPAKKNMRSHYILGLALASQQKFAESTTSIKTFLGAPPAGTNVEQISKQLAQIEEEAARQPAGSPSQ